MNELQIVEQLKRMAGGALKPAARLHGVTLGIGDDCAIFRPRAGEDLVFTTDQIIEEVHFVRGSATPASAVGIGHRALARSLSDLAAMGAEPCFCLVSLALPQELTDAWVLAFYRGLMTLARRTNTVLAGGDLAHATQIYCDVMACGRVPRGKALRRDRAKPGDQLCVSGKLGKPWERRIEPRIELGIALRGVATACMDLSDGISLDLRRMALASGVAAEIDRVPVARGSTVERALHGGEDYELLFTIPAKAKAPRGTTVIGHMTKGPAGLVRYQGVELAAKGYDHFKPV